MLSISSNPCPLLLSPSVKTNSISLVLGFFCCCSINICSATIIASNIAVPPLALIDFTALVKYALCVSSNFAIGRAILTVSENVAATYKKTTDAAVVEGKDYYTKSGSTYTKVDNPVDANIASYYEVDVEAHPEYTTYLLGKGAFEFENIGVKVPSETARDPKTNGGIDILYTRQRHLVSPKYISYTKASQSTSSATKAELATGSNWELVHDGALSGRTYVNHKAIPIVKIVSRG